MTTGYSSLTLSHLSLLASSLFYLGMQTTFWRPPVTKSPVAQTHSRNAQFRLGKGHDFQRPYQSSMIRGRRGKFGVAAVPIAHTARVSRSKTREHSELAPLFVGGTWTVSGTRIVWRPIRNFLYLSEGRVAARNAENVRTAIFGGASPARYGCCTVE
jgi:hypothetical protein